MIKKKIQVEKEKMNKLNFQVNGLINQKKLSRSLDVYIQIKVKMLKKIKKQLQLKFLFKLKNKYK